MKFFNFTVTDNNKQGFTLIELLVVVSIIGMLTTLGTVNAVELHKKARDSQRKADLAVIQSALEQYRNANGAYPVSPLNNAQLNATPCGHAFVQNSITYQKTIPCDPLGAASNYNSGDYYYYSADGSSYVLAACLERKSDSDGQASQP